MPVGIMYSLETERKKRRAITCPSHNPIIVSMNQPAPEKQNKVDKEKNPSTAPGCPCRPWGSSWEAGLEHVSIRNCKQSNRGKRTLVDVGEDTTLGNGDVTQELVQLLIVADGKLKVTRNDTGLLVVTGGVASQLQNFSGQVLQDGSEVHGGTGTDTLSVVALAKQTVDTANGEGQTGLGRTAGKLGVSKSKTKVNDATGSVDPNTWVLTTERSCCR